MTAPLPASPRDAPRAAHVIAAAFAASSRLSRLHRRRLLRQTHVVLSLPVAALVVATACARRTLYIDRSGTGVVCVGRRRLVGDALVMALFVLLGAVPAAVVAQEIYRADAGVGAQVLGVGVVLAVLGFEPYLSRDARPPRTRRRRMPRGHRWDVTMLAQLPGTKTTAARLALRVVQARVPVGDVLVAVPATRELRAAYERLGFKAVRGRQMAASTPLHRTRSRATAEAGRE